MSYENKINQLHMAIFCGGKIGRVHAYSLQFTIHEVHEYSDLQSPPFYAAEANESTWE